MSRCTVMPRTVARRPDPATLRTVGVPATEGANAIVGAVDAVLRASWPDAAFSLAVVAVVAAIMLVAPRLHRLVPGSIVAIVVVTVIAALAGLPVATIGELPSGLPAPVIPAMAPDTLASLLLPAATVAALAAIESLLSARVAATMADTGPYDADRELVGQGLASIASALFGGMPATGAIARTAERSCDSSFGATRRCRQPSLRQSSPTT